MLQKDSLFYFNVTFIIIIQRFFRNFATHYSNPHIKHDIKHQQKATKRMYKHY